MTLRPAPADFRVLTLGTIAWAAVVITFLFPVWVALALVVAGVVPVLRRPRPTLVGAVLVFVAGVLVTRIHVGTARASPVVELAARQAVATADLVVRTEPRRRDGRFGPRVSFEASLVEVVARGHRYRVGGRVSVVVETVGAGVVPGSRLQVQGRLASSSSSRTVALLAGRGPPRLLVRPGPVDRAVNEVRAAVRAANAGHGSASALIPALVDGDESAAGGTDAFAAPFRIAGMTHLLAVSGTNLTIVVGGLLVLARWCRVRAQALLLVAALGVVGFVLLAGPEPSVVRAAAMGVVGIIGLGRAGPGRGLRALGTAILVLVLCQPALGLSLGFTLSVVATAGILLLGPLLRGALARWLPRWVAEAVAVPLAAQLACTPVVAAISGQVSLVAVAANILVAPLVAPATVCGLAGGLVGLVAGPVGRLVAAPAGWCGHLIIAVAVRSADLPVAALAWDTTPVAIGGLAVLCAVVAVLLPRLLRRRGPTLGVTAVLLLVALVPLPEPGWPPPGWVLIACDVGQGDVLALRTGPGSAVVIDAGPDPALVDRCLRRLHVRRVPVLVLTHFHADHIDGLSGVLRHRGVGRIDVSPLAEPAGGHRAVQELAARAGVPVRIARTGERTSTGSVRWQVLGPVRLHPEAESPPNESSLVLLVEAAGVRLLMLGDEERAAQADLRRAWPSLVADVLKVAHHGSARQDADLVREVGARLALISVGRDNDYGHPADAALDLLTGAGMKVLRTDRDGDVAVVVDRQGRLAWVRRGVDRAPSGAGGAP